MCQQESSRIISIKLIQVQNHYEDSALFNNRYDIDLSHKKSTPAPFQK